MKMLLLLLGSTALSSAVVAHAYYRKQQFYPTVVYLLSSSRTMGVLYLQGFLTMWMLTIALKNIFFGTLRAAEVEHLIERSWYAVLETFILLASFHQEMSIGLVSAITVLFICKAFHWLAEDRVDYMERSPIITWKFHLRAIFLLLLLLFVDFLFVQHSVSSLISRGTSVQMVFGLEYAIMFLMAVNTLLCYVLHTLDLQSEEPWENKTFYLRCIDIVLGFLKLCLYIGYMAFMFYITLVPLHIARRVYMSAKHFQKSVQDVILSRQAIRNLNTLYPDATPEELESSNNVCIICREEMVARCKKLPCNHIFHTACLQSWFQRQQSCPTCRHDVLQLQPGAGRAAPGQGRPPARARAQPPNQQQQGRAQGARPGPGPGMFPPMGPPVMPAMWHGMVPPHPPPPPPHLHPHVPPPPPPHQPEPGQQEAADGPVPPATAPPPATATPPASSNTGDEAQTVTAPQPESPPQAPPTFFPGFFPPPFPPSMHMHPSPMAPPMAPFPGAMPSEESLRSLSDEDLRSLEGMERSNVEARIALLRNVQRLLDTAVAQLNQYSAVMSTLGPGAGPGFPGYPSPSQPPPGFSTPRNERDSAETSAGPAGLFHSQTSVSAQPLLQPLRSYSFSGSSISGTEPEASATGNSETAETGSTEEGKVKKEEEEEEEVKSKLSASPQHVDTEVRQCRLQRFHSVPNSTNQNCFPETIRELTSQIKEQQHQRQQEEEEEEGQA